MNHFTKQLITKAMPRNRKITEQKCADALQGFEDCLEEHLQSTQATNFIGEFRKFLSSRTDANSLRDYLNESKEKVDKLKSIGAIEIREQTFLKTAFNLVAKKCGVKLNEHAESR